MKSIIACSSVCLLALYLTGCGTVTGIPAHGGGKRFAVEQELVAGTVRAAVKQLDLSALVGRRVSIFMVGMGDEGAGNLIGGKYSIEGLLRGEYVNTPNSRFPVITTTTDSGGTITVAENALNVQEEQKGVGGQASVGARYQGMGAFTNSQEIINPEDSQFLSAAIQQYFVLKGIQLVAPSEAEIDVYVLVDVFGTIRSRTDWHVVNSESLVAKTALECLAIHRQTGELVFEPQAVSYEGEYKEHYAFWAGPYKVTKELRPSDGLLATYNNIPQQPRQ